MFGMALRTYHNQVSRLSESGTFRGRSLWEALLAHIKDNGPLVRADVLPWLHEQPSPQPASGRNGPSAGLSLAKRR